MISPDMVILSAAGGTWNVNVRELTEMKPADSLQFGHHSGD